MVDGGFPSLEKQIPNLIAPFRRSRGAGLSPAQLAHNRRLHEVRRVVERFFGRMKKHMNIVGTIYRGDLGLLPQVWLAAAWLTDLHIAAHP